MKFEDMINNITLGDSYKLIKDIPDKSIDLIIIDPPYEIKQMSGGGSLYKKNIKNMFKELKEKELDKGVDFKIFDDLLRIMKKPNIYIWCNKTLIPKLIDFFVNKNNLKFDLITWHKTNAMPLCGGSYLIDTEYCLYFREGIKMNTTYDTAKTHYEIPINIKDKEKYKHPTIKPLSIIKNLIINSSNKGEVVLDCFSGSGTTCVASKELNRKFIGIEIDAEFYKISLDRLNGMLANGQISFNTDLLKLKE